MSLVSRLLEIARAQIGSRLAGGIPEFKVPRGGRSTTQDGRSTTQDGRSTTQDGGSRQARGGARPVANVDPEMARYYANLELPYGADLSQVKEARKRLMRRYHPDLHSQDPEKQKIATEIVQGLNRAYEQLKQRLEK